MMLEKLLQDFASNVAAQTAAVLRGDAKTGNRHAKKYIAAAKKLRTLGDEGWDAFATLLKHPDVDVRTLAATYLLPRRTIEARAVLEEAAKGEGLIAFEAAESLKRWDEGVWDLGPK
ncbi:DUF2019 domain-containing protein [Vitiosangium sp. GDMCC 1.1324]|uniref:DUF2019 domain-containing protein n=1 Tax=Vitiosangium sp. (strain GDMCC 1.1324) TaxID=2138576 RepID=UPI000D3A7A57|nr:DUF2019 domain-containing protein [Vitiosangium sp. GDMCC 1.1324]PTL80064.1 hypothetical protein DAT35_30845 [Vitiosangium sp. GDMCC 1.1324]